MQLLNFWPCVQNWVTALLLSQWVSHHPMPTCQLDVHVGVQKQVLRLEVAVDDVVAMTVVHCCQNLPELLAGFCLAQSAIGCKVVWREIQRDKQREGWVKVSLAVPGEHRHRWADRQNRFLNPHRWARCYCGGKSTSLVSPCGYIKPENPTPVPPQWSPVLSSAQQAKYHSAYLDHTDHTVSTPSSRGEKGHHQRTPSCQSCLILRKPRRFKKPKYSKGLLTKHLAILCVFCDNVEHVFCLHNLGAQ